MRVTQLFSVTSMLPGIADRVVSQTRSLKLTAEYGGEPIDAWRRAYESDAGQGTK